MIGKEVWLITGASSGLGLYFAKSLLQNGQRVAAVSRNGSALQDTLLRTPSVGVKSEDLLCLSVDLTEDQEVEAAIRQSILHFGRIDGIVNYAGCDLATAPERLTNEHLQMNFEENIFGRFHVLKHVLPHLRNQGAGMILNYSSPAMSLAVSGCPVRYATHLAIEQLSAELTRGIDEEGVQQTFIGSDIVRQLSPGRIFSAPARNGEPAFAKRTLPQPPVRLNGSQTMGK